jgi:class 3 adenylate cyclase
VDEPEGLLKSAREAVAAHLWQEALEGFLAAEAVSGLSPEDLEALSEAAFWSGNALPALDARQRAYSAYVDQGRSIEAASAALVTCTLYFMNGDTAVASGWLGRAQRLLVDLPECAGHAQLAWLEAQLMLLLKGHAQALDKAREVEAIGARVGDRDLVNLGICMQGNLRLHTGDVSGGMGLLDEALAAALAGELGPFATAEIFCEMVVSCLDATDYQRAAEWLETADRAGHRIVCFPGCCRVHRATLLRHRGDWSEAQRQAHQARAELAGIEVLHEGMALTEMGELYRCRGELSLAEKAFAEAYEKGWPPQPGLALVLFAKNDLDGAGRMIERAVEHSSDEPAALLRLLPAQVEIALTVRDTDLAQSAADRLATVAASLGTSAALAADACVTGLLLHQGGDFIEAASQLGLSVRSWQKAHIPYEAAQVRMRLAGVLEALGDPTSANLELSTAQKTFKHLGAAPEAREAARRLGGTTPFVAARTFMFTDIVDSTTLLTAIGDDAWHLVRRWHDSTVSAIVAEHLGRIVKETGDGFFAVFEDPPVAVDCAVAIQRTLEDHRRTHGFSPAVRIGLHVGSAISVDDDYAGRDVVVSARIGALAAAGEILVSADLADRLSSHVCVPRRTAALKGIPDAIEISTVEWR